MKGLFHLRGLGSSSGRYALLPFIFYHHGVFTVEESGDCFVSSTRRKHRGGGPLVVLAVIGIILVILAALGATGYVVFRYIHQKTNYVPDHEVAIDYNFREKALEQGAMESEAEEIPLESREEYELIAAIDSMAENADAMPDAAEDTYNLLLIGSDRRDNSWYGNSDAMILVTINDSTRTIYLTSFMRDLYAYMEGYGVQKLNSAHAYGAGVKLVETLSANYGVKIDNYATADFSSMEQIIDILVGLDLEINPSEAKFANEHIYWIASPRGQDPTPYYLTGTTDGSLTHVNGLQAVSYSRVRKTGSDYERTSRQREVLLAIIQKARSMDIGTITALIDRFLPMITHNLDEGRVLWLLSRIPSLLGYSIEEVRVPFDNYYNSINEILVPVMPYTIDHLRSIIYATGE